MSKKKLSEMHSLKVRVHNLEIALVAALNVLEQGLDGKVPAASAAEALNGIATHLFECNTTAKGFSDPKMVQVNLDPDKEIH